MKKHFQAKHATSDTEPASIAVQPERMCTKCLTAPAGAKHAWCVECSTEYHATNRELKRIQDEALGFGKGVEAMRETLAIEFMRLGMVTVQCFEVGQIIQRVPRPQYITRQLNGAATS